ncbi:spore germination protein [Paenibacillus aurantiacus]|uniref:Spore germination protein n=1 Tax=Paenibacillus aurantiacus TaxID=1936118 RepID=A0ABV5KVW8_9BACL
MDLSALESLQRSADFKYEQLDNGTLHIELLYHASMVDLSVLNKEVVHPFRTCESAEAFRNILSSVLSSSEVEDEQGLLKELLLGKAVIRFAGTFYTFNASKSINNSPNEAATETTLQGSQHAFSEDADTNLLMLRKRYPYKELTAEHLSLGRISQTSCYFVYDTNRADETHIRHFRAKLSSVDADMIQAAGQIDALISGTRFRWFPTLLTSERPDRAAHNLALGKVVLIIDGTPFALIGPAVFFDFVSAMDDLYLPALVTKFLVMLRYIGIFLTIMLPALYVAIVSYNPEIFRLQFTISIAGSRAAVPFPSYIEVFIMMFLIEALIEASLRLPRYIGSTATTVGGLILGQAAQQAGLVSSIMVIVTSVVAISNFLIPINTMSFALRLAKYPLILLAAFFGIAGLITGVFGIGIYCTNLRSFGQPYLKLFLNEQDVSGYKEGGSG